MNHYSDEEAIRVSQLLAEAMATEPEPASSQPQPRSANAYATSKEPTLSRAQRRELKRGHGGRMPGNNRPNRNGALVQQRELAGMLVVGEEKRLVEVMVEVRGKGGKKKLVRRKTMLSREIISTGKTDLTRLQGTITPDEVNDSIKNSTIQVRGIRNGRVLRA